MFSGFTSSFLVSSFTRDIEDDKLTTPDLSDSDISDANDSQSSIIATEQDVWIFVVEAVVEAVVVKAVVYTEAFVNAEVVVDVGPVMDVDSVVVVAMVKRKHLTIKVKHQLLLNGSLLKIYLKIRTAQSLIWKQWMFNDML